MKEAPQGAVFIWLNNQTDYPRRLAKHLGREDLLVVGPHWLDYGWAGRKFSGIVVDHAAAFNDGEHERYQHAILRIRPTVSESER